MHIGFRRGNGLERRHFKDLTGGKIILILTLFFYLMAALTI
jgi:hypothetical protein